MTINNLPEYAKGYKWIVATESDNEYWFWGAYNDPHKAAEVAEDIDGIIYHNK